MCVCVSYTRQPRNRWKMRFITILVGFLLFYLLGITVCKEYSSAPAGALLYTMVDPNKKHDQLKDEAGNELENSSILKNG